MGTFNELEIIYIVTLVYFSILFVVYFCGKFFNSTDEIVVKIDEIVVKIDENIVKIDELIDNISSKEIEDALKKDVNIPNPDHYSTQSVPPELPELPKLQKVQETLIREKFLEFPEFPDFPKFPEFPEFSEFSKKEDNENG